MKPLNTQRKLTDIRVTRKSNVELSQAEGHGWAVSYADMLMVLLSFFVIFFSLEDDPATAQDQLRQLAMSIRGENASAPLPASKVDQASIKNLATLLDIKGMHVTVMPDRLVVDLKDTSFRSGHYNIDPALRQQMDLFYTKVAPFKKHVLLTVIGHADKTPMRKVSSLLRDNFDLSSVRALTALKYLTNKGLPAHLLSARAASSFERNSRSISFEIRLQQAKPEKGT